MEGSCQVAGFDGVSGLVCSKTGKSQFRTPYPVVTVVWCVLWLNCGFFGWLIRGQLYWGRGGSMHAIVLHLLPTRTQCSCSPCFPSSLCSLPCCTLLESGGTKHVVVSCVVLCCLVVCCLCVIYVCVVKPSCPSHPEATHGTWYMAHGI